MNEAVKFELSVGGIEELWDIMHILVERSEHDSTTAELCQRVWQQLAQVERDYVDASPALSHAELVAAGRPETGLLASRNRPAGLR